MTGLTIQGVTQPVIIEVPPAAEDTPLLSSVQPQERSSQDSSIVGVTSNGYHTHPTDTPESLGQHSEYDFWGVVGILSVLLIGVFISQTDGTLLIANIATITSEFNELQSSGWLISSYSLAMCVAQPLYGKLSDIFGRKMMLQIAYLLFAVGGAVCGLGQSMTEVIVGRVIQGSGGAGMVSLVSILITDLVPLRDVAVYRSYVNIVATAGRSCGGPLGGALAQTIGWRWAFISQAPLTLFAMILVAWKLDIKKQSDPGPSSDGPQSWRSNLQRIDFLGALFMSTTILSAMLILDMGGAKVDWLSPVIMILFAATLLSGALFCVIETHFAKEPIFPLKLLSQKAVVLSYLTFAVQIASQMALMLYIPLYFQVTKNSSPAEAGSYLVPSVFGNTIGGLLSGSYVKRTGRYKPLLIICGLSAMLCFTLLLTTWNGHTPIWQALFVFFGGFATGIAGSVVFVDLAASVEESDMAIASSGLYLSSNIGSVTGVTVASTILSNSLKPKLDEVLAHWPHGHKIAEKSASSIEYVQNLTGKVHELVLLAYIYAFKHGFLFSLICATLTLFLTLLIKEKRLDH